MLDNQKCMDKPVIRRRRPLTARQLAILRLIAAGRTTDQIAEQLGVSRNTIRDHVRMILLKFNVSDRAHAVALAMREGLIR